MDGAGAMIDDDLYGNIPRPICMRSRNGFEGGKSGPEGFALANKPPGNHMRGSAAPARNPKARKTCVRRRRGPALQT